MKASTFTPFPPGVYPMRIRAVEEREGKYGLFLIWGIEVEGVLPLEVLALERGRRFSVLTSSVLMERNNFGRFLEAIGIRIDPNKMLRTESLVGHRFTAMVDVVSKDGVERNIIRPALGGVQRQSSAI